MPSIPTELTPLLQRWTSDLARLPIGLRGVYLYGSLALDDWNPLVSDIDAVVVTAAPIAEHQLAAIASLHDALRRSFPFANRLEVQYLPATLIGNDDAGTCYPCFRDGRFLPTGRGDLNAVTGWLLHHRGLTVTGNPAATVFPEVPWDAIERSMAYNLDTYWKRQIEQQGEVRFLSDAWVEFAITTLCRIMSTLCQREIVAKEAALQYWGTTLPIRWHPLLDEALRLRRNPLAPSHFATPYARMQATVAFIEWVQGRSWQRDSQPQ